MAESSRARSGQGKKDYDVQELLKSLNLHEAELNEVVLGKEEIKTWPEVKWLAAAKVLTEKSFSLESLKKTLHAAWTPAREVTFHAVEENLFVLQAHCLGDWNRVMLEGPWLFRGCALMVEPFDGTTMIPTVIPSGVQAWIQIHKIPPLFRNKQVLEQLGSRVGEVTSVDLTAVQTRAGDFHRVQVKLDSTKPLTRFVPLVLEGHDRMFLQIKYEKIPRFCDHCGRMGHTFLECGSGEYEDVELQFGDWMVSEEQYWRPGTPGLRVRTAAARESGGGRGRLAASRGGGQTGRGAGMHGNGVGAREQRKWRPKEAVNNQNKKQNSEDAGLDNNKPDDIRDTATIPLKQTVVTEPGQPEAGAKKMLLMDGEVDQAGLERVPPPPPAYVPPAEKKKKMRKAAAGGAANNDEAGSGVEHRQLQ
ncbi:hypothetical protein ACQ4PT_034860 [Festuca glaucescens]